MQPTTTLSTMEFQPVNVSEEKLHFNERLAMKLTLIVSNMLCAYAFLMLAIVGFPPAGSPVGSYVQWFSQTCIQLVFLPILSITASVTSRRQDKIATQQYQTTLYLMNHLAGQDAELLKQSEQIAQIVQAVETIASKDLQLDEDTHNDIEHLQETLAAYVYQKAQTHKQPFYQRLLGVFS